MLYMTYTQKVDLASYVLLTEDIWKKDCLA